MLRPFHILCLATIGMGLADSTAWAQGRPPELGGPLGRLVRDLIRIEPIRDASGNNIGIANVTYNTTATNLLRVVQRSISRRAGPVSTVTSVQVVDETGIPVYIYFSTDARGFDGNGVGNAGALVSADLSAINSPIVVVVAGASGGDGGKGAAGAAGGDGGQPGSISVRINLKQAALIFPGNGGKGGEGGGSTPGAAGPGGRGGNWNGSTTAGVGIPLGDNGPGPGLFGFFPFVRVDSSNTGLTEFQSPHDSLGTFGSGGIGGEGGLGGFASPVVGGTGGKGGQGVEAAIAKVAGPAGRAFARGRLNGGGGGAGGLGGFGTPIGTSGDGGNGGDTLQSNADIADDLPGRGGPPGPPRARRGAVDSPVGVWGVDGRSL